jgi:putative addiction module CopG family antidote
LAKAFIRGNLSQKEHNEMMIRLPEHLERFVHDQVHAGRYLTEDEVITDALEQLRQHAQPIASSHGLIGALRDDAELLDYAVEHAMKVREERPWRLTSGE